MKRPLLSAMLFSLLLAGFSANQLCLPKVAALATSASASTQSLSPEEVIRRFTTKESELREVWKEFTYRQETKFQVLGPAKTISGEFFQVSEFVFNDAGKRMERIVKAPISTLDRTGLLMSAEDRNALINLQPFALTAEELPNYKVSFVGKEKIDDLNAYVFEVVPKALTDARELKRLRSQKIEGKFFQGRVWVDDQDFQIVKTAGKVVPEFEQRFPKFETYRENISGRYWLPTYTYGDDTLEFDKGGSFHVRLVVRYLNYRQFQGDLKILDAVDESKEETPPGNAKSDDKNSEKKQPPTKRP